MTDHRAQALAWLDRAEHDHADRSDETLALSSAAIGILHALLAQTPEPRAKPEHLHRWTPAFQGSVRGHICESCGIWSGTAVEVRHD